MSEQTRRYEFVLSPTKRLRQLVVEELQRNDADVLSFEQQADGILAKVIPFVQLLEQGATRAVLFPWLHAAVWTPEQYKLFKTIFDMLLTRADGIQGESDLTEEDLLLP
jgi:hypothetical protein